MSVCRIFFALMEIAEIAHLRVLNKVLGEELSDSDNEGFEEMVSWTSIAFDCLREEGVTVFARHSFSVQFFVWVNSGRADFAGGRFGPGLFGDVK